jgi:hypothetical protein
VDPDRARELLTTELSELDERARFAADSHADAANDPALGEGAVSQHPGDYGSDVANRMEDRLLLDTVEEQRRRVQDALARLDDGTSGRASSRSSSISRPQTPQRP